MHYLGLPKQQGQVASSIPDLTDWLANAAVRLPPLLTHTWDESYVPSHDPLQVSCGGSRIRAAHSKLSFARLAKIHLLMEAKLCLAFSR